MVAGEKFTRVAYRSFHDWLLPERAVVGILSLGFVFVFVGIVLLAIGRSLTGWGAAFFGIGMCLCIICLLLCLYACFVMQIRDQETQTMNGGEQIIKRDPDFIPTYAVIDKKPPPSPSSLRNGRISGTYPKKHVTMAPDVQQQPMFERNVPVHYQTQTHSPPPYGEPNPQYPARYSPYEYPRGNQSNFGFPLHPSQPTPYSTLSQKQPHTYPMQVYPPYRPSYDEDYDNAGETYPMMPQAQNQRRDNSFPRDDEPPEPQPLVYPSARRPMTFEQVSSSKMSIYDNVQFGLDKLDEEE